MRPGRELDTLIAKQVFGHNVKVKQKELWEETPKGEKPLRPYSRDITYAWEVVEKMNITLLPIENNSWFALVSPGDRWTSPAEFLKYLSKAEFEKAGAAVGESAPLTICLAALKAIEHRHSLATPAAPEPPLGAPTH